MSNDSKVVEFPKKKQEPATVEIQLHPNEVIDVEPQILAVMKARLAGECLDQLFSRDDQITNDLSIELERKKLRAVFRDIAEVFKGFSSLDAIRVTRGKLREHQVDKGMLASYAKQKAAGQAVDEVDLYAHLVGGVGLKTKVERVKSFGKLKEKLGKKAQQVIDVVAGHYLADEFGVFGVSREMAELSPEVRALVHVEEIQGAVDEILAVLYGSVK